MSKLVKDFLRALGVRAKTQTLTDGHKRHIRNNVAYLRKWRKVGKHGMSAHKAVAQLERLHKMRDEQEKKSGFARPRTDTHKAA